MAWLWKDHTGFAEAAEITALARKIRPQIPGQDRRRLFQRMVLQQNPPLPAHRAGGVRRRLFVDRTGRFRPRGAERHAGARTSSRRASAPPVTRRCTAQSWGGYPDKEFLSQLDPKLGALRDHLPKRVRAVDSAVGGLTAEWAESTGLPRGHPRGGRRVRCASGRHRRGHRSRARWSRSSAPARATSPSSATREKLADVPGLCGIVDGSVLPGYFGLEAGQSAVGDIFNWFVNYIQPGGEGRLARDADGGRGEAAARRIRACWRWIGTTATARSWWTSA